MNGRISGFPCPCCAGLVYETGDSDDGEAVCKGCGWLAISSYGRYEEWVGEFGMSWSYREDHMPEPLRAAVRDRVTQLNVRSS